MSDELNLNPKPVPGPADLRANTTPTPPPTPYGNSPADAPTANPGTDSSHQPAAQVVQQSTFDANKPWPGAFEITGMAFNAVMKNPKPMIVFVLVTCVLAAIDRIAPVDAFWSSGSTKLNPDYESLANLIFLLALPVYYLAVADKKVISVSEFLRFDLGRFATLFVAYFLSAALIIVSAIAFLVPLVWMIPWLIVVNVAVVDRRLGPIAAIKESKRLVQGHIGKAWGIIGVAILASLIAFIPSMVPILGTALSSVVSIVFGVALAMLYRWLQVNGTAEVAKVAAPTAPTPPASA